MNICSLPKAHKIHLCRNSLIVFHPWNIPAIDLQIYDQHRCKKHRIRPTRDDRRYYKSLGEIWPTEMHFHLLLCPVESWEPGRKYLRKFVYLLSNLEAFSMTMLSRDNKRGTRFIRESVISDVNTHDMVRDRRRVRKKIYPTEIKRKQKLIELQRNDLREFEQSLMQTVTIVRPPITMAKTGQVKKSEKPDTLMPVSIVRIEPLVEDILISFSEIKVIKFGTNY